MVHYITEGAPISEKANRLIPEKLKTAKFEFMVEQVGVLQIVFGQIHFIW